MSDVWRCENGHSGTLDTPRPGELATLPEGCPICGASTLREPRLSLTDETLVPAAAPKGPRLLEPAPQEATLQEEAPAASPGGLDRTLDLTHPEPAPVSSPDATCMEEVAAEDADGPTVHTDPAASVAAGKLAATLDLLAPSRPTQEHDADRSTDLSAHTADFLAGTQILGPARGGDAASTVAPQDGASSAPSVSIDVRPPSKNIRRVLPAVAGYELLSELGRGGMGVVYKARQLGLNRLVALKMILAANRASARDLARFHIEAEAVAQLVHPNIVQIFEVGEREGCPFFSLEFVAGGTLADYTEAQAQPPRRAARIVRALAAAMDFAHRRGIIHRDLKPANVLIALPETALKPEQGAPAPLDICIPKITDFGLAKRLEGDSGQTRDGAIMGTPNYMAPEQARGKTREIGPAADIYALGSILYDLLTGTPPFKGSTIMETLQLVMNREPVPPRQVNVLVPSDLSTICLKCLEKDPAKRYATAGELAEDLRRYLEGEPILARSTTWLERGVKWSRRRPATAALVGVCVLAVLGMSLGGVAFALHEQANAAQARSLQLEAETERENALTQKGIAETARRAAEANFLEACSAVDEMLLQVGSQRLAAEPRMEIVRRELLNKAAAFYAKHLKENSSDSLLAYGNDPNVRWRAARSSYQLGGIEQLLGNANKAEDHYHAAAELLGELKERFPTDRRYRQDLANAHHHLGVLYAEQHKWHKAEKEHEEAQTLRKVLVAEDGDNTDYQYDVALSTFNLGQVEFQRKRLHEARTAFQTALEQTRHLQTNASAVHQQLARVCNNLGQTLQELGERAEAKKAYEQARDTLTKLAEADREKASPEYRHELSLTYNNLGQLQIDTDPTEAEKAYDEALKLARGLIDDFPSTPMYRQLLAIYLNNLGVLYQARGESAKAEDYYQQALNLRRRLVDEVTWKPDFRRELAVALRNRGGLLRASGRAGEGQALCKEAVELMRALTKDRSNTPDYEQELGNSLYHLGTLQAGLQKPQEAETLLREALQVYQSLVERFADRPDYRANVGNTRINLGVILVFLDPARAEEEYRAAIAVYKRLIESPDDMPDYRVQLAMADINLGDLLSKTNHGAEAYPLWQEARDLLEPLAERYRSVPGYRQDLGRSYSQYPVQLVLDKKLREADEEWEKARVLQHDLVKQFPLVPEYRFELAKTLSNLALVSAKLNQLDTSEARYLAAVKVLDDYQGPAAKSAEYRAAQATQATYLAQMQKIQGHTREAQATYERIIGWWQELANESRDNATYRSNLARAQYKLGSLLAEEGTDREALAWLEKAVQNQRDVVAAVSKQPAARQLLLDYSQLLLDVYRSVDDHAALARAVEDHLKWCDSTAQPRVEAATRLAGCLAAVDRDKNLSGVQRVALRMLYAELAMHHLQEAAERGFKDAAAIQKTEVFAPLRRRADYQDLVRKMAMGAQ